MYANGKVGCVKPDFVVLTMATDFFVLVLYPQILAK